jgi:hypothetical protein
MVNCREQEEKKGLVVAGEGGSCFLGWPASGEGSQAMVLVIAADENEREQEESMLRLEVLREN